MKNLAFLFFLLFAHIGYAQEQFSKDAMNRYSSDDILKLGKLMSEVEVEVTEEGYLKTAFGDTIFEWVQQDDLIFRDKESSEVLVFERNEQGEIAHAFVGGMPTMVLDKLERIDTFSFHRSFFLISLLIFLTTLGGCFLLPFFKRKLKVNQLSQNAFPTIPKRLLLVTIIAVLLFYLGVALIFSKGVEIIYGLPTYAYLVFSLPLWISGLTVVLCYHLILLYKNNRTISYWKKGGFTLVWLCLVACIFQWNYWNFIGFNF